jgi:hypothetical protein
MFVRTASLTSSPRLKLQSIKGYDGMDRRLIAGRDTYLSLAHDGVKTINILNEN